MAHDSHLTHNDLSEVLQQLRRHVATRDDLRELADAIDADKVRCQPIGWRLVVTRDPKTGQIVELVALPFVVPAQ